MESQAEPDRTQVWILQPRGWAKERPLVTRQLAKRLAAAPARIGKIRLSRQQPQREGSVRDKGGACCLAVRPQRTVLFPVQETLRWWLYLILPWTVAFLFFRPLFYEWVYYPLLSCFPA